MNAEGILEHLKEVDSQLKSTLGVANLKSISFMGPEKDMKGVMDATKGLGPMYYDTFASVMWKDNFSPGLDRTLHLMQFFDIKEGKIEEAKKVFEELCQVVEGKDTDTLMYQFGVSGNKIMGQELFKDYGGLMSHLENVKHLLPKLSEVVKKNQTFAFSSQRDIEAVKKSPLGFTVLDLDYNSMILPTKESVDSFLRCELSHLLPKFNLKPGKKVLEAGEPTWKKFYQEVREGKAKCPYYGFGYDSKTCYCIEVYESGSDILSHLQEVDAPLKETLESFDLEYAYFMGSPEDLKIVKEPTKGLPSKYLTTFECSMAWPKLISKFGRDKSVHIIYQAEIKEGKTGKNLSSVCKKFAQFTETDSGTLYWQVGSDGKQVLAFEAFKDWKSFQDHNRKIQHLELELGEVITNTILMFIVCEDDLEVCKKFTAQEKPKAMVLTLHKGSMLLPVAGNIFTYSN
ncbi:hypothetical protein AAMO2058_001338800 [Amorphochlora amoebiformis]